MAYLPDGFPTVTPTLDDATFWEHCVQERLAFQRCAACGTLRHPPAPICGRCQSREIDWAEAPRRGRIYSYTIAWHPTHPAATAAIPYNVVLVEFPQMPGVRLISNVVEAAYDELAVGLVVELVFETDAKGRKLPRFRLERGASGEPRR